MNYPPLPSVDDIVQHVATAVRAGRRNTWPYVHWKLADVLPVDICTGILTLPIAPPVVGRTDGTRGSYNAQRTFVTPSLRSKFPACAVLAEALQRPVIARILSETLDRDLDGGLLRIEYIQDLDGAWLKPHCGIPEKLFSLAIYLFTGPHAKDWGTDLYDADVKWVGRAVGDFNSGTIFVAGPDTWHGFEPRPIIGVRRLLEISYVRPGWRSRDQLSFPDRPISLTGQA